jgi:hypothetical protein
MPQVSLRSQSQGIHVQPYLLGVQGRDDAAPEVSRRALPAKYVHASRELQMRFGPKQLQTIEKPEVGPPGEGFGRRLRLPRGQL